MCNLANNKHNLTFCVVDRYELYLSEKQHHCFQDLQREAQNPRVLAGAFGPHTQMTAIVHSDDQAGAAAYRAVGYRVITVNGDRAQKLPPLLHAELDAHHPDHLLIISSDAAFLPACELAKQRGAQVRVWMPNPDGCAAFDQRQIAHRPLDDVLPNHWRQADRALIWIDLENILIELVNQGGQPDMAILVGAIRRLASQVATVCGLAAYADFSQLQQRYGSDIQRTLAELGVRTHYVVNHRGKNSADMEIAHDIHTCLERDEQIGTVMIVSADRDFRPTVEAAHARSKRVVVLAFANSVSRDLARAADALIDLSPNFCDQVRVDSSIDSSVRGRLGALLRVVRALQRQKTRWIDATAITQLITIGEVEALCSTGLLHQARQASTPGYAVNTDHPDIRAAAYFAPWIDCRVKFLLKQKKMPHVDTHYLARGMRMDEACINFGIGQTYADAQQWLDAAVMAGILVKQSLPQASGRFDRVATWWPADGCIPFTLER